MMTTTLDRWLPASVTLGAWGGYCWIAGPYGPLDGFLLGAGAVIGTGALLALIKVS
jgi:hypothetical protein